MRWQQLFADLQAQFDEAEWAAERAESASRTRSEIGSVTFADRLRGAVGAAVVLRCRGAGQIAGALVEVGPDWLLVHDEHGRELLVATAAVGAVTGLTRRTAAADPRPVRVEVDLRRALRGLVRDRSAVCVVLDDGAAITGTFDRVGADFVEVAEHEPDEPRRHGAVRAVHAVPIAAVAVVVPVSERLPG
jgi:hypothetical protein